MGLIIKHFIVILAHTSIHCHGRALFGLQKPPPAAGIKEYVGDKVEDLKMKERESVVVGQKEILYESELLRKLIPGLVNVLKNTSEFNWGNSLSAPPPETAPLNIFNIGTSYGPPSGSGSGR